MCRKQAAEQHLDRVAALRCKGFKTLDGLEHARLRSPRCPALTAPEWGLLTAFGLGTLEEVQQRMNERALLAAYDGAPSSLCEMRIERAPAAMGNGCGPNCTETRVAAQRETVLETRMDYDPDRLRACVRYMVSSRQFEQAAGGQPLETEDSRIHAVTFDVRTGGVVQREYGTIRQVPGQAAAQHDVAMETVAQRVP